MSVGDLQLRVECYVAVRKALGYACRSEEKLLKNFVQTGKEPSTLHILDMDAPAILSFLDHLERQRNNQAQSRNVRLAAVHSFFRMVAIRDPASVGVATRVLAIPVKRTDKRLVGYLTRKEMDALLNAHELSQWAGRRDHALLLTLYNTRSPCVGDYGTSEISGSVWNQEFRAVQGQGKKGASGSSVVVDRPHPASMV